MGLTELLWFHRYKCKLHESCRVPYRRPQKLALDGTDYQNWEEVGKTFENAVNYRNIERKEGKRKEIQSHANEARWEKETLR